MIHGKTSLENFERAFADGCGSSHGTCACGKTFYDGSGTFIEKADWDRLKADKKAVALGWGISWMTFEGSTYVLDCDCWHKRAEQVMRFLYAHRGKIAEFFKLERQRLLSEAASLDIEGLEPAPAVAPPADGGATA